MRDNIYTDDNSSDFTTKKFWAHGKSKTKLSRIPETIHLSDTSRSDTKEKADHVNAYFYDQFTKPSNYDINVNFPLMLDFLLTL